MSKVRVAIDFPSMDKAREWLENSIDSGTMDAEADAFPMDSLDLTTVTMNSTWIIRRAGSRTNGIR